MYICVCMYVCMHACMYATHTSMCNVHVYKVDQARPAFFRVVICSTAKAKSRSGVAEKLALALEGFQAGVTGSNQGPRVTVGFRVCEFGLRFFNRLKDPTLG